MSKKDYYSILGIPKTADDKEIKRAFRKLAKKYHPDTNQGNAAAEQHFKEVNEAYDILGDPEKRKLYDRYGEMAFREGFDPEAYEAYRSAGYRSAGSAGGGSFREFHFDGDVNDLFSDLFRNGDPGGFSGYESFSGYGDFSGRGQRRKGTDLNSAIVISFEDAVFGCDRMIQLTGTDGGQTSLQVHIPAGIDEGQKVRLRGKGNPGKNGGAAGDLFLEIHILPKAGYERKGTDVYVTAVIPFTTAALGGEAVIPTLHGNVVCQIAAGTQSGSKIRLKGKGIVSMKDPSLQGDEYAVIQIEVPKTLSEQQRKKLREYAQLGGTSGKNIGGHAA